MSTAAGAPRERRRPFVAARFAVAGAVAVAVFAPSCSKHDPNAVGSKERLGPTTTIAAANPSVTGTLDVIDQITDGKMFRVEAVTIAGSPNGGWIALHTDDHGGLGTTVGTVHVPSGTSRNVTGSISSHQASGAFWVTLHADDHAINSFDYGRVKDADLPVRSGNDVVRKLVTLTVR